MTDLDRPTDDDVRAAQDRASEARRRWREVGFDEREVETRVEYERASDEFAVVARRHFHGV